MKNDNNILKTNQLEDYYELDDERRNTLQLRNTYCRIQDNVKKTKKSIDLLTGSWWNQSLPFEPKLNQNCASVPIYGVTETEVFISPRKKFDEISWKQQRLRLASVLEAIQTLAEIEQVSEVKIAAKALQATQT